MEPVLHQSSHHHRSWQNPKVRRAVALGLAGIVLIVAGVAAYTRYLKPDAPTPAIVYDDAGQPLPIVSTQTTPPAPTTEASALNGIAVDPALAKRRPLAVMVENHPEARPQAGLSAAANVWETMTEGGITRFMGIFSPADADKIGPVRSARPYFIAWASGYHALYAHAGGSQAALGILGKTSDVVDLPHAAKYFHREPRPGIASEHTLFTSSKELYDYAASKKAATEVADFPGFKFHDEAALDKRPATATVTIDFSAPSYLVKWVYDKEKNAYSRNLAGQPHTDANTKEQIFTKNLVVLTVDRRYDPNTNQGKGEWFMTTEGQGKALLFKDGQKTEATWKKPAAGDMLRLYGSDGEELTFNRGQIWFTVIPPDVTAKSE